MKKYKIIKTPMMFTANPQKAAYQHRTFETETETHKRQTIKKQASRIL